MKVEAAAGNRTVSVFRSGKRHRSKIEIWTSAVEKEANRCVCLTVIVIPSSALAESSFYRRVVSSFCDIQRITDGWRRGRETESHREGEDPLQPQLGYSLRKLYVALKARKDRRQAKECCGATLAPTVHALRDGP